MRVFAGVSIALLLSSGLFAQGRGGGGFSGAAPRMTGGFGSVVFPGGTPATSPGTQRFFGSTNFPGGGGPRLVIPNTRNLTLGPRYGLGLYGAQFGYGVSWFYYGPGLDYYYQADQVAAQQMAPQLAPPQPNVVVVYPQQSGQQTPSPLLIHPYPGDTTGANATPAPAPSAA